MNAGERDNASGRRQEGYIPVITRKETARVDVREILFIESELRVVNIYTYHREYRFYGKLSDVTKYLSGSFYRCHKSCIINLDQIIRMEDGVFYFKEGRTLRVGQNNYRHTRNQYIRYLEQNADQSANLK